MLAGDRKKLVEKRSDFENEVDSSIVLTGGKRDLAAVRGDHLRTVDRMKR